MLINTRDQGGVIHVGLTGIDTQHGGETGTGHVHCKPALVGCQVQRRQTGTVSSQVSVQVGLKHLPARIVDHVDIGIVIGGG